MAIIYLNGQFLDRLDAGLDPLDRGVLLGDGIFETIRCEEGQLIFHVAHFGRLGRSARITRIPWNRSPNELLDICQQVLDANGLRDARLRVTVTRGESDGRPDFSNRDTAPTLIVSAAAFNPDTLQEKRVIGYSAIMADFPKNHRSPIAEVKSTNYLENLLAKQQATDAKADEAIFLNTDGLLAEGSMSNLFLVSNKRIRTPLVEDGALPGIVRLKVALLCARLGIDYTEETLTLDDLRNADEAFLTNSIMEIMPLTRLEGNPIGNGNPGPLTARVFREHRKDVDQFLETMRSG